MSVFEVFNPYIRRARLTPALLVVLPAVVAIAVLSGKGAAFEASSLLWSLAAASGGTILLAELGRDMGKRKERVLFDSWGGKPSTRLLRHRANPNATLLQRRHAKFQQLVPNVVAPTPEWEAAEPVAADQRYEAYTAFLLEQTRDRKRFPLLFQENCSYGFRRNLWGMKGLGLVITLVSVAAVSGRMGLVAWRHQPIPPAFWVGLIFLSLWTGMWLFWFTREWVRIPAEAYAERLLAAVEVL